MTSYFEDSGKRCIESAIEDILSRCKDGTDERAVLKDLISTAHLLIHKRNIQYQLVCYSNLGKSCFQTVVLFRMIFSVMKTKKPLKS